MTIWSVSSTINDGKSGAPAGNPQYPAILSSYVKRPSWNVAGVDYAVGIPANVTLQDPWPGFPSTTVGTAMAAGFITQAGGSGNIGLTAGGNITLTTNNRTFDGWDFSLHGGMQVIPNGSGTIIQNCNFAIGANGNPMLNANAGGSNLTLQYCHFNANGNTDGLNQTLVYISGGTTTILYNLFENAFADAIDMAGSSTQTYIIKYNVMKDIGKGALAHADFIQQGGATYTNNVVSFNTFYQTGLFGAGGFQGVGMDTGNNSAVNTGANILSYNTMIALTGSQGNYWVGCLAQSGAGNTFLIDHNYFDSTGLNTGASSTYKYVSAQNTQTNNINMVTGAALNS